MWLFQILVLRATEASSHLCAALYGPVATSDQRQPRFFPTLSGVLQMLHPTPKGYMEVVAHIPPTPPGRFVFELISLCDL